MGKNFLPHNIQSIIQESFYIPHKIYNTLRNYFSANCYLNTR